MNITAKLLTELKRTSIEFNKQTGKSLGLVGEIGEQEVAKLFKLRLSKKNNNPGFDARTINGQKVQIKSAVVVDDKYNSAYFSHISATQDWTVLLCCVYNASYRLKAIYRLTKRDIRSIPSIIKSKSATLKMLNTKAKLVYGTQVVT